jgi:hypothetical protein
MQPGSSTHNPTHPSGRAARFRPLLSTCLLIALGVLLPACACASGPRWVTGPPYFTGQSGLAVVWFTTQPLYFTDPGDLSASVDHAAADAMVAAAAGVWNVPTSAMVLAQGGALAEHVSGANAFLSNTGPVFPADVHPGNYAAIQIAILYDTDGSVTDMLLGGGASDPVECRQNGVTESVDSIVPAGFIQHAILVLNGRCTGPAPEQQMQMQYQLERAFGRILGVGWSQTNDNVFTRTPSPTPMQATYWPIMHPIDVLCGEYTYQCQPQPLMLRDDDVASITTLYPMMAYYSFPSTPPAPGKVWSYQAASQITGTVTFPTGQGMQGVNVLVQRRWGGAAYPQGWADISSVSGFRFQQSAGNPVSGSSSGPDQSMGSTDSQLEGFYNLGWIPNIDNSVLIMMGVVSTEAINPLYVGAYSVGPYVAEGVSPSGAPEIQVTNNPLQLKDWPWGVVTDFAPPDAASNCSTGGDGVESAPNPVAPSGWWTGVLCARGHTAWSSFTAQAGRTATLEVTALDESGFATTAKAMPLLGVWTATDALGTLPSLAATPSALNSISLGMTAASVSTTRAGSLRFVIADQRGDGRPDFAYKARLLYANAIQPAIVSANGGQVVITGTGFRRGNEVTIDGVPAVVTSWTATTIVAVAPPESAFAANPSGAVDVAVTDLSTSGTTIMTGALTYANIAPDVLTLISAPSGTVEVGSTLAPSFAVRVFLGDGVTPVAGLPVTFSASPASVEFGACFASPCILLTDATGLASTTVTPTGFAAITLGATAVGAVQTATFNAVARAIAITQPQLYIAAGATVDWTPEVTPIQNGAPAAGAAVTWSGSPGMSLTPASSVSNASGVAQIAAVVGPLAAGAGPLSAGAQATGQACAWVNLCANFTAAGIAPSALRLIVISGAGQSIASPATFAPVVLMVTDTLGHPVAGAAATVYQTVNAAEMPCPARGPCPIAPVLGASTAAAVSGIDGLLTVTPKQLAGTGEVTNIAAATGTQGFISLSLDQQP